MDIERTLDRAWVVLVTEGTTVAYPPEIYSTLGRAVMESERWAWILGSDGAVVERPFDGRWRTGDFDIRLVEVDWIGVFEAWIGTYWDRDGNPDPEAVLLSDREDARSWVEVSPRVGVNPVDVIEQPWELAATYVVRGEATYATAQLAKCIVS
jgi:hypothetical protein